MFCRRIRTFYLLSLSKTISGSWSGSRVYVEHLPPPANKTLSTREEDLPPSDKPYLAGDELDPNIGVGAKVISYMINGEERTGLIGLVFPSLSLGTRVRFP